MLGRSPILTISGRKGPHRELWCLIFVACNAYFEEFQEHFWARKKSSSLREFWISGLVVTFLKKNASFSWLGKGDFQFWPRQKYRNLTISTCETRHGFNVHSLSALRVNYSFLFRPKSETLLIFIHEQRCFLYESKRPDTLQNSENRTKILLFIDILPGICLFMLLSSLSLMPSWPSEYSSSNLEFRRDFSKKKEMKIQP